MKTKYKKNKNINYKNKNYICNYNRLEIPDHIYIYIYIILPTISTTNLVGTNRERLQIDMREIMLPWTKFKYITYCLLYRNI